MKQAKGLIFVPSASVAVVISNPQQGTLCLPHEDGGMLLSVLPRDTTSKVTGFFSTLFLPCSALSKEALNTIFIVVSYDLTRN